jgi:hypothetical protein
VNQIGKGGFGAVGDKPLEQFSIGTHDDFPKDAVE